MKSQKGKRKAVAAPLEEKRGVAPAVAPDIIAVQSYHERHQSLGEVRSESCQKCQADLAFSEIAPISELDEDMGPI